MRSNPARTPFIIKIFTYRLRGRLSPHVQKVLTSLMSKLVNISISSLISYGPKSFFMKIRELKVNPVENVQSLRFSREVNFRRTDKIHSTQSWAPIIIIVKKELFRRGNLSSNPKNQPIVPLRFLPHFRKKIISLTLRILTLLNF